MQCRSRLFFEDQNAQQLVAIAVKSVQHDHGSLFKSSHTDHGSVPECNDYDGDGSEPQSPKITQCYLTVVDPSECISVEVGMHVLTCTCRYDICNVTYPDTQLHFAE